MAGVSAIILAAGKSTRMRSAVPKVLHDVCGVPMLEHVLRACRGAGVARLVVVVGHDKDRVVSSFSHWPDVVWVEQVEQKGTGHAALVCERAIGSGEGACLVIAGDMPLIRSETIRALLAEHDRSGAGVTLATSVFDDPSGYGRIVRDESGGLIRVVEELDCSEAERAIGEVNISYYCFDAARMFDVLREIQPNPRKGEYYITDAVSIMLSRGYGAGAIAAVDQQDAAGVNSRADLATVCGHMQSRIQDGWMEAGVTIVSPPRTWIEVDCRIGGETVIHPFCHIARGAVIGSGCTVGPFAWVSSGEVIADGQRVLPRSVERVGL